MQTKPLKTQLTIHVYAPSHLNYIEFHITNSAPQQLGYLTTVLLYFTTLLYYCNHSTDLNSEKK